MHRIFVAALLVVFWVLLSGHFSALLLTFGGLSMLLVSWFLWRMEQVDGEQSSLYPSIGLVGYLFWLLWCVVKANVDLARRIWHPSIPLQPVWSRLDTEVTTPLEKTLYANSITLTPGTLTTDVHEDHFMIHALSQEGMDELREGEMERRIRRLGI